MSILVIAEHDNAKLVASTAHAVGAASKLGAECHVLVAGHGAQAVAQAAAARELTRAAEWTRGSATGRGRTR